MNKKVKRKWLKALRSGEYSQGYSRLVDEDDNFCCLGVLCDLHARETGGSWDEDAGEFYYKGNTGVLPKAVVEWAGLDKADPWLPVCGIDRDKSSISFVNDIGYNFKRIADLIEEHL